jgi:hypothetical protein
MISAPRIDEVLARSDRDMYEHRQAKRAVPTKIGRWMTVLEPS